MKITPSDLQKFGQLEFLARQVVEGFITGLHKSPFHGFSVEFAEHRLYNKGESTRHIDWKLYARTDKLFVKRYEEETNLRCQIIIDGSSSMYYPLRDEKKLSKIQFSIVAAAALMHMLKMQRDAVGLSLFSEAVDFHAPARSSTVHQQLIMKKLEEVLSVSQWPEGKKTLAVKALHELAESTHKRSLIIIFSDMMESFGKTEELFSALQHFKHNKHEVILFHTLDKDKEIDFNFTDRPYTFVDMESGEEVKLHSNEIRDQYTRSMNAYMKELHLKCSQYRIDLVEADINQGVEHVLMPYLIRRQKMIG
jgi:uncharacterized protein (DUF58 family)